MADYRKIHMTAIKKAPFMAELQFQGRRLGLRGTAAGEWAALWPPDES